MRDIQPHQPRVVGNYRPDGSEADLDRVEHKLFSTCVLWNRQSYIKRFALFANIDGQLVAKNISSLELGTTWSQQIFIDL